MSCNEPSSACCAHVAPSKMRMTPVGSSLLPSTPSSKTATMEGRAGSSGPRSRAKSTTIGVESTWRWAGNASPSGASSNSHWTVGAKAPATIARLHSGSVTPGPKGRHRPSIQRASSLQSSLTVQGPRSSPASPTGASGRSTSSPPPSSSTSPPSRRSSHTPSTHPSPIKQSSAVRQGVAEPPQSQAVRTKESRKAKRVIRADYRASSPVAGPSANSIETSSYPSASTSVRMVDSAFSRARSRMPPSSAEARSERAASCRARVSR